MTVSVTRVDERCVRLEGDDENVALALMQIRMEGRFGQLIDSDETDGRTSSLVELQAPPTEQPDEQVEPPEAPLESQETESTRPVLTHPATALAVLAAAGLAAWGVVLLAQWLSSLIPFIIVCILLGLLVMAPVAWGVLHFRSTRTRSNDPAVDGLARTQTPAASTQLSNAIAIRNTTQSVADVTDDPEEVTSGVISRSQTSQIDKAERSAASRGSDDDRSTQQIPPPSRETSHRAEDRVSGARKRVATQHPIFDPAVGRSQPMVVIAPDGGVSHERQLAVIHEQLSVVATRSRMLANASEDVADSMVTAEHDSATAKAFAAVAALDDAALKAEAAATAALVAADIASRFDIPDLSNCLRCLERVEDRPDDTQDGLTDQWLATLRDPNSGQAVGRWRGAEYDLVAAAEGIDISTAVERYGNDRCAVDYLLELDEPYDGPLGRNGNKHPSMHKMKAKYGERFLKEIIQLNDSGVTLPKIADHVERALRHRSDVP